MHACAQPLTSKTTPNIISNIHNNFRPTRVYERIDKLFNALIPLSHYDHELHELINCGIRGVRQSLWTKSLHSTNRLRYRYDIAMNIRENRFDSA